MAIDRKVRANTKDMRSGNTTGNKTGTAKGNNNQRVSMRQL